ncbi:MAG TPA: hypothetical protein VM124_01005 [Candidatus Limnocylindrales bacterium]|nr:hypothetical protein [Candidatus Limnocylindrales bacterium]
MKLSKLRTLAVTVTAALSCVALGAPIVQAQSAGVQLSPLKTVINLKPGSKDQVVIMVKNVSPTSQKLTALFDNFTSQDETGEPKIIEDASFAHGLKSWMSGIGSFSLAPGASRDYGLNVSVPASTKPGTYYGLVRFSAGGTAASVGSLVLVNVGDISQQVAIQEINTDGVKIDNLGQASGKFAVRLKNTGSGYVIPKLKLEILDDKKTVIDTLDANKGEGGILPDGNIRRYEADFSKKLEPNKTYSVRVTVAAGTTQPVTQEKKFVEAPVAAASSGSASAAKKSNILPIAVGAAIVLLALAAIAIALAKKRNKQLARMPSAVAPQPTGSPLTPTDAVVGDLSPNQPTSTPPTPAAPEPSNNPTKKLIQ